MLSVLIPVYNYNVISLVSEIHRQITDLKVDFEIIVTDDGSISGLKNLNRAVSKLSGVQYEELTVNIGRSRIRNRLASAAKYPCLLFMDCDTEIERGDFISTYLKYCNGRMVICGGRSYKSKRPDNPQLFFHWKYGSRREQIPAGDRNLYPWNSFMTNNFVIPKSIFNHVQFDPAIEKYGHEDTFFGIELKRHGIPVLHIDNPLLHIGLETSRNFLKKTEDGIENLAYLLSTRNTYRQDLILCIKLLKVYESLGKAGMLPFFSLVFKLFRKLILLNLHGQNPNLRLFDFYKLGLLMDKLSGKMKNIGSLNGLL